MRLVLDLQAVQASNRNRGIGRYALALARAIANRRGDRELLIVLNGNLPERTDAVRSAFKGLLSEDEILVWRGLTSVAGGDETRKWQRQASERLREAFIGSLRPDVVHVASVFEGFEDDAVTSIGHLPSAFPTAATLYDLIPFVHREKYLGHPQLARWYWAKLSCLERASLWLAISQHTRQEAIEQLGLPPERVVAIGGGVDELFCRRDVSTAHRAALAKRYGFESGFIMCTGGIDHRKNLDGLLKAYALLDGSMRRDHPLLIACHVEREAKESLNALAASLRIPPGQLILTGFVPDDDLVALYNICSLFVFPSWHEGLGLPVLEAMACGAPVVASNLTSLPELIARDDAMFDPHRPGSIAAKLAEVLRDANFRFGLRRHGLARAADHSWDRAARLALEAFDEVQLRAKPRRTSRHGVSVGRPPLIVVTPLPPARSGIADYSADLLPALAQHYDIDVVVDQASVNAPQVEASCRIRSVDWFEAEAPRADRIVYQIGNSHFHKHMLGMMERHPGLVVLHDFFLGGLLLHMEVHGLQPQCWSHALYRSHGYSALAMRFTADATSALREYPANYPVLRNALGVIVHSAYAQELASRWYDTDLSREWAVIPQVRAIENLLPKAQARKRLNIDPDAFLVCSFGIIAPSKLNHRLLDAWRKSSLSKVDGTRLVFVGDYYGSDYGRVLNRSAEACGLSQQIAITGFCTDSDYRLWLAAADAAVQLRHDTRGETSRAVLDCMAAGVPTIVNAHGTMRDFSSCLCISDGFHDEELSAALERLRQDSGIRLSLGQGARARVRSAHAPREVARQYREAIEHTYRSATTITRNLLRSVVCLQEAPASEQSWLELAQVIAHSLPPPAITRQLLVDVTMLDQAKPSPADVQVLDLIGLAPEKFRVEPICLRTERRPMYARQLTCKLMGLNPDLLQDEQVEYRKGDVFLALGRDRFGAQDTFIREFRAEGGVAFLYLDSVPDFELIDAAEFSVFDGVVCCSRRQAKTILDCLQRQPVVASELRIGFIGEPLGRSRSARSTTRDAQGQLSLQMLWDPLHANWLRNPRQPRRDAVLTSSPGMLATA
jgi:glycosyltransferase involved in cell wall biosynthesis